ncbi:MAG: hypothetical protein AAFW46_02685 [Pseudomonadota bacterium]
MAIDQAAVKAMKTALGAGDGAAAVAAAIEAHGEGAAPLLRRAAKGSKAREEALADLLLARGDAGCAVSDAMVGGLLGDAAHPARSGVAQKCAFDPRRIRLAPALRPIAADRSDPDWSFAVMSLGALRDPGALDLLMEQTCGVETPFPVLAALVPLRAPEAALLFEPMLAHPEPRYRTYALWGLAGVGYETAVGGLVALLEDPDMRSAQSFAPGQARRAAQALADLFDWPFEARPDPVAEIRARCRERFSAAFVEACAADLGAGRLRLTYD